LKVIVVDDSIFFTRRVSELLNEDPDIEVVGQARDGKQAVEMVKSLRPDVVTMDIQMPIMDGITAVKHIMASVPTPILMFSSLTHEGAQATLDSLDAGALDFLPKNFEDIAGNRRQAITQLQNKIKEIGRKRAIVQRMARMGQVSPGVTSSTKKFFRSGNLTKTESTPAVNKSSQATKSGKKYAVLAIGASTGGPVALQNILGKLPENFPYPIILVQHMPDTFTAAFAERLDRMCKIEVKEASSGDTLLPGRALLAPGGMQMLIESRSGKLVARIVEYEDFHNSSYKPSVDVTFDSLSKSTGDALAIILTGMGVDGREGCKALKAKGAKVWAQDEQSCVVYGMPQAIAIAGIAEKNIDLSDISGHILKEML
jgi:two-component system chemotaxis response regulator CheB